MISYFLKIGKLIVDILRYEYLYVFIEQNP